MDPRQPFPFRAFVLESGEINDEVSVSDDAMSLILDLLYRAASSAAAALAA